MKTVLDGYSASFDSVFGMQTETGEFGHHDPYCLTPDRKEHSFFYIKIWKNNVLPASETRPSQVHVGQEKYIKRLWKTYKSRRCSL